MEIVRIHSPLFFDHPEIDGLFRRASRACHIDPECYDRAKDDFKWMVEQDIFHVQIGRDEKEWVACAVTMLPGVKLFQPQLFMFHCDGTLALRRALAAKCVAFVKSAGYNRIQTAIALDVTPEIVSKAGGVPCKAMGQLVEFQI